MEYYLTQTYHLCRQVCCIDEFWFVTARIRRMTGGYAFTKVCLLTKGPQALWVCPVRAGWMGVHPPPPSRDGGYPPFITGWGYPCPVGTGWGTPAPLPLREWMTLGWTGYAAGGMPLAVSRSCTFLLQICLAKTFFRNVHILDKIKKTIPCPIQRTLRISQLKDNEVYFYSKHFICTTFH